MFVVVDPYDCDNVDFDITADDIDEIIARKSKARIRHMNDIVKIKKKINIANNKNYYRCGMWFDEDDNRLYDPGNVRKSKQLRVISNRTLRRSGKKSSIELPKKSNAYRKLFEYWYELT